MTESEARTPGHDVPHRSLTLRASAFGPIVMALAVLMAMSTLFPFENLTAFSFSWSYDLYQLRFHFWPGVIVFTLAAVVVLLLCGQILIRRPELVVRQRWTFRALALLPSVMIAVVYAWIGRGSIPSVPSTVLPFSVSHGWGYFACFVTAVAGGAVAIAATDQSRALQLIVRSGDGAYCPNGHLVPAQHSFCWICGARLHEGPTVSHAGVEPEPPPATGRRSGESDQADGGDS
ncbi:MAG TPA: hypothetical protein VGS61_04935 [Acidimicrobiales bacterium]|nr:hypothetical protein [Acidimicrobiales bacterium]